MKKESSSLYKFFNHDAEKVIKELGKDKLKQILREMLLIRNFEIRGESAYLQGKVGGFYHSYHGQEAIATAAVMSMGRENWWSAPYRVHALALLLGAHPKELMAELYGKATGNAKGRGGSMHFFTDRLLGGAGIVGGQIPLGTGAGFSAKYLNQKAVSVTFMGDGAVAQGAFHESLNLAALMNLPCIYVIENNMWGMGTSVERAISVKPIAEIKAPSFGIKGYTFDGMDFFNCYAGFKHVYEEVKDNSRPVLIEAVTERFRGHSISDPGLYRSKEQLHEVMERDPLLIMFKTMAAFNLIDDEEYQTMDKEQKALVLDAMKYAEESPWPDPITLEEDVYAP